MQFNIANIIGDICTEDIPGTDKCDISLIETTLNTTEAVVPPLMPSPNQPDSVSITPMSMNNNDLKSYATLQTSQNFDCQCQARSSSEIIIHTKKNIEEVVIAMTKQEEITHQILRSMV